MNFDISYFLEIFSRILTLLLVIPVHEAAHGLMAKWLGDDTAERQGRITLNPMAHIDPWGSLLMILTGFGWAKPVNVNPLRMKKYRAGFALTALAGPASNLISALIAGLAYNIMLCFNFGVSAADMRFLSGLNPLTQVNDLLNSFGVTPRICFMLILIYLFYINIGLAVFNLIPVPPLDGFNILRAFTSEKVDRWFYMHQREISIAFIALIFLGRYLPFNPLGRVSEAVSNLFWNVVDWIPAMRWA